MVNLEFLTTGDVARRLDVSPDFIRQLARAGRLPALLTRSGQRLFLSEDVEQLTQARAAKQKRNAPVAAVPA